MDSRYSKFVDQVASIQLKPEDSGRRGLLISLALGLAAARTVSLPSTPVQEQDDFFNTSLIEVRRVINGFNENCVFDMREAEQMTRAIWKTRYNALYPSRYLVAVSADSSFIETISGGNQFSKDVLAFATKYQTEIFILSAICCEVIDTVYAVQ